jgi:hypothetical protein
MNLGRTIENEQLRLFATVPPSLHLQRQLQRTPIHDIHHVCHVVPRRLKMCYYISSMKNVILIFYKLCFTVIFIKKLYK